jgi:uncharacterized membrane protein
MLQQRSDADERLAGILGKLLRSGVILASSVVVLGGLIFLYRHGQAVPQVGIFHGEPSFLRSVSGILQADLAWRGQAIIQLGILLLILTPVARLVFSFVAFAKQGDRTYMLLTFTVLAVLLHSFVVAL